MRTERYRTSLRQQQYNWREFLTGRDHESPPYGYFWFHLGQMHFTICFWMWKSSALQLCEPLVMWDLGRYLQDFSWGNTMPIPRVSCQVQFPCTNKLLEDKLLATSLACTGGCGMVGFCLCCKKAGPEHLCRQSPMCRCPLGWCRQQCRLYNRFSSPWYLLLLVCPLKSCQGQN